MSQTLTEFLLARIAEDEQEWREFYASWPILVEGEQEYEETQTAESTILRLTRQIAWLTNAEYIRKFGNQPPPAPQLDRLLAQCAALRAIIEHAWDAELQIEGEWGASRSRTQLEAADVYPDTLKTLALVWADHPDFRPEWRLT